MAERLLGAIEGAVVQEGIFDLELRSFSALPHVVGERFTGPKFELCGRTWCLQVHPGGETSECAGFLSVYLRPVPNDAPVSLWFKVLLFAGPARDTAQPLWSSKSGEWENAVIEPSTGRGWPKTMKHEELLKLSVDDTITVRFFIKLSGKTLSPAEAAVVPQPPQTLARDMAALFDECTATDVVLVAGGREFRAHRGILSARSSVMKAMFDGRFREGKSAAGTGTGNGTATATAMTTTTTATATTSTAIDRPNPMAMGSSSASTAASVSQPSVVIEDVSADTMQKLLRFMYCGSVVDSDGPPSSPPLTFDDWASLLAASDRFDVEELFGIAQCNMASLLAADNALECLAISLRYAAAAALKVATLNFLAATGLPTEAIDNLEPDLLKEIIKHPRKIAIGEAKKPDGFNGDDAEVGTEGQQDAAGELGDGTSRFAKRRILRGRRK